MDFIQEIRDKARGKNKKIVLPESKDERILEAASILETEGIASVILIGKKEELEKEAKNKGLDLRGVEIIDPETFPEIKEFASHLYELRKEKGMTQEDAESKIKDPLYFSTMLVEKGYAHGSVAGAANATGDVLRPALQIIKTAPGISVISGAFIMLLESDFAPEGKLVFADCAVNPEFDSRQLAEVGVASAQTARSIGGLEPRTAFLSFSTKGSAQHQLVEKVVEATEIAKQIDPDNEYEGELQADTALVPSVGEKKAPDSSIAGKANVLVFPDLQSGNIGYKLVQRLAGAQAVGPILQGMAKPVNDLSRGCSVDDIVNLTAITVLQSN